MCGIVAGVSKNDIIAILIKGLHKLEYRGYDSAGVATFNESLNDFKRVRSLGKVSLLEELVKLEELQGAIGVAHTRWATHGKPAVKNAHPHSSDNFMIVHNGIVENYDYLKTSLIEKGYKFSSDTDTEVIAHLLDLEYKENKDTLACLQNVAKELGDNYGAIVVLNKFEPNSLVAIRSAGPLVIGFSEDKTLLASDQLAIAQDVNEIIYLEQGDSVFVSLEKTQIFNKDRKEVVREKKVVDLQEMGATKEGYSTFMEKEIYEQPTAIQKTIAGNISSEGVILDNLSQEELSVLKGVSSVSIVACGTAYNAGVIAKYWIESILNIPCSVEVASEYRYRNPCFVKDSLFLTLSQSGETADTLAALRLAKENGLRSMTICNVKSSSLVRESDISFITKAGPEIGVASTKAFTTQLASIIILTLRLGKLNNIISQDKEKALIEFLHSVSYEVEAVLQLAPAIKSWAQDFKNKDNALFLGRGESYAVALEGALKVKEISYIHAEACAAGETKHGPLALVDENMPVIVLANSNNLLAKIKSNINEVHTRGGNLYIVTDKKADFQEAENIKLIEIPIFSIYSIPFAQSIVMQLLALYLAVEKGANVDQPRNLAKAVTVE
ncbi:MAG: glutamine--fructose-6-phosphate transaminase (isomerizing) [Psittacicella sp.]